MFNKKFSCLCSLNWGKGRALFQFLWKRFWIDDKRYFVIHLNIAHCLYFVNIHKTLVCFGGCIREARSRFAVSIARECTFVHDRRGAAARREIDHGAPLSVRSSHNIWDINNFFGYLRSVACIQKARLLFYGRRAFDFYSDFTGYQNPFSGRATVADFFAHSTPVSEGITPCS